MNVEGIRRARDLIATVGNPQGLYAGEVMKLFHESLDSLEQTLRLIEEKNRALFNIINIIGPTSAAKCEGCLFEMEEALRIARAAFEDKPIEKRKWSKRPR